MDRWWTLLQSSAVPALGLLARFAGAPRRRQRIEHHIDLLGKLPEELKPPITGLLAHEVDRYAMSERSRVDRRVDGAAIGAIVLLALVGGAGLFIALKVNYLALIVLGYLVAVAATILIAAGSFQIYKTPDDA